MARVEQERRDIGAELRSFGVRAGKSKSVHQHQVRAGRAAGRARPVRLAKSRRSGKPLTIIRGSNRKRIRVGTTVPRPTADRSFDGYELTEYEHPLSGLRSLESDPQSLILAVDGACLRNGLPGPRASFGVFVSGERPELNETGLLPLEVEQTSQIADLYSAMKAVEKVHLYILNGHDFSHVVIKTNSDYLYRGISQFIWKWKENGFRNWEGKPVVNGPSFKYLHEKLELLEAKYGIKVSVCRVSREKNERASWLARLALREVSYYDIY